MHKARVARAERRIEALPPPTPSPAVMGVWHPCDADALAFPALPAWFCRHADDTLHAGDGAYLCPLSTPGAPSDELTGPQAVAIMQLLRARRAAERAHDGA